MEQNYFQDCLEPHDCLMDVSGPKGMRVRSSNQQPFTVRLGLAPSEIGNIAVSRETVIPDQVATEKANIGG